MTCFFFYVDESFDDEKFCLSALWVKHRHWDQCLDRLRMHRSMLKERYGIPPRKEIHATELLSGRGSLAETPLSKWERSRVFQSMLKLVCDLPEVQLINICLESNDHEDPQYAAWDRLINRIERSLLDWETREGETRKILIDKMSGIIGPGIEEEYSWFEDLQRRVESYSPRAVIVSDEGREQQITKMLRRMRRHNPIPSAFGTWDDGSPVKNIVVSRIIEDPVFRDSKRSYFLQLVDCIAFALLKSETKSGPYNVRKFFNKILADICFTKASTADPLGIVRK